MEGGFSEMDGKEYACIIMHPVKKTNENTHTMLACIMPLKIYGSLLVPIRNESALNLMTSGDSGVKRSQGISQLPKYPKTVYKY